MRERMNSNFLLLSMLLMASRKNSINVHTPRIVARMKENCVKSQLAQTPFRCLDATY